MASPIYLEATHMIGQFLIWLGIILLFFALLELTARGMDKISDWRDFDRERRDDRREALRRWRDECEYLDWLRT